MAAAPVGQAARWFEDFRVGQHIVTQSRTIGSVDTALWCMFTGDMHPFHVDDLASSSAGLYGERFPPGLMSVAICSGLWERLGLLQGTGLFIAEQTIRYRDLVRHGDTIHMELDVQETQSQPDRARGIVVTTYAVVRSDGTACVEGELSFGVSAREVGEQATSYGIFGP